MIVLLQLQPTVLSDLSWAVYRRRLIRAPENHGYHQLSN